ncbi:carbohydrate kinase family protein [Agriterribacter sp.]|uniref:carbohydrate kinase family protein n=1 Tax=Agriterribacter sp. TaxID=2821509 RepID=UPI002B65DABE|nr:carbohydrate kinase family protein [Agriterribacter sp.]HTN08797.1 carbohydrate kinase family protein [Agriterribacter sp.]
MKKYDAVIAGYVCVDLIPAFKKNISVTDVYDVLKPGKLVEIDGLESTLGGVVANTGMAMKKFSKKVFLNGLIGTDFIGKIARESLDKYKLSEGIRTITEKGTAFGLVIAPPGVDRIFLESPGCSELFDVQHINYDAIADSRLFHFGYPPLLQKFYRQKGKQLTALFRKVDAMNVVTSLDFSLPDAESESGNVNWAEVLRQTLPYTDVFVPSLEEALKMVFPYEYARLEASDDAGDMIDKVPLDLIKELGETLVAYGANIVLIKAAHRGLYLWTHEVNTLNNKKTVHLQEQQWNNRQLWCNAYHVEEEKVKNASGAGDTSAGAFLAAILDGEAPDTAMKFAAIAGRNNLYCNDIYAELNDWETMIAEMNDEPNAVWNVCDLVTSAETGDNS